LRFINKQSAVVVVVFRIVWRDDQCSGTAALGALVDVYENYDLYGILGLPCSTGNLNLSRNAVKIIISNH